MAIAPQPILSIRGLRALAAAAILIVAAMSQQVLAGEPAVVLMGNHPVADFTNFGPADKDRRLDLEIIFALRNKSALDELLAAQQDPNSPDYHHWLTPNEFSAKFGPNLSDVRAVAEWLEAQRFTAISADSQDRSIRFNSTVSDAERAFGVAIVASANGLIYGNTSDPMIPARFAGVIARIEGLDNMRIVVPLSPASRPGVVAAPSP
jgi:kumamolisin